MQQQQLSLLVSVTLVIMLGGLATFQIVTYVRTLEDTTKEINKTLRHFIEEQNQETQRLLKTNLDSLTDVVQAMQNDLEFLRKQQLTPLQQLMQDVLTREAEIVRMLEHIPMIIKPIDYEAVVPAEFSQQLSIPSAPSFRVSLFPPGVDEVSDALRRPGATPPGELWNVAAEVLSKHSNKVIIDVGGNIGYFGLMAASLGHRVYAFETSKQMAEKYAQGVALNSFQSKVTIYPVAVHSSSAGKASIASEGNQVVQLGKIDDYVPQSPDLFILKLSGVFDKDVVQGAQNTIQSAKFIFLEATPNELSQTDPSTISTLLSYLDGSLNYSIYRRWRDANSKITEFKEFATFVVKSSNTITLFCARKGSVSW